MKYVEKYFLLAVLMLTSWGCSQRPVYRIGISQCSSDDWRIKMNEEIEREMMFHPDVKYEIRSAEGDSRRQIEDLRYFVDNNFDLIIAAPNEADALTPVIKKIYSAGTPVIIFDRDINDTTYTAFQGADNAAIGRNAARYARSLSGHQPMRVMELYGLPGSTPARERHRGFAEGLHEDGAAQTVATAVGDWTYEDALPKADSLFALHPEVNVVFAHNDRMAIAARKAAENHGLHPYIIGVDAAPNIGMKAVRDSVIDATFLYPTEGHNLVRTAISILENKPFQRLTLFPLASAVDGTNADILLMQDATMREETTKMKEIKKQLDVYWDQHSAQTSLLYAVIALAILLAGFIFLMLRLFWSHKRHREELEKNNRLLQEERDKQSQLNTRLQEATQSKLIFFTNVSHDLRTPLTLIAEPIEQLAGADNLTPRQNILVRIADKNVRILRRLITQILDFRKYENGRLSLNLSNVDFRQEAEEWIDAFRGIARGRDLHLEVKMSEDADWKMAIDVEKIERVFYNIMSNAFKYTPANGHITFEATVGAENLTMRFTDDGPGISAEDLPNIFERFFQVEKVNPNGSGIGLALAKSFVELHDGTLRVESELGRGSTFIVTLPVRYVESDTPNRASVDVTEMTAELRTIEADVAPPSETDRPLLLVIDDNLDILQMVKVLLSDKYAVITASNGRDGVRMAAKYVPDAIVCDVMMPVMDGMECCRLLKEEVSTSHIPVLMLTACALDSQRAQGYESGADGYISKPFDSKVLRARIDSLIANRRRVYRLWEERANLGVGAVAIPPDEHRAPQQACVGEIDSEFYRRFLEIVQQRMGEPELNVDVLASAMGLGRSQFYRKVKALTNYSPVELLRRLRLEKARELLARTEKSISEIAYQVGFSTPAYFSKCYREAYGEKPSDLRSRISG